MRKAWLQVGLLLAVGCGGTGVEPVGEGYGALDAGVECVVPSDCVPWHPASACGGMACLGGACVFVPKPAGTPVGAPVPGTCVFPACDGTGGLTTWFDKKNGQDDGNPCTEDRCTEAGPVHVPWPQGSVCGTTPIAGGLPLTLACNANVQCVLTCADGLKDGNETDVDCGGHYPCSPCPLGATCHDWQDCTSQKCGSGICLF